MAFQIIPTDKIDFVARFIQDPCDAPFTVYAASFGQAFLEAVIAYYMPNIENILGESARPGKGPWRARSERKGKNGSKSNRRFWRRAPGRILGFQPDEFIGKKIGAFIGWEDRTVTWFEGKLWIAYNFVERVGFWIFIIHLTAEFFYRWASLAEESVYCRSQRASVYLAERIDGILLGITGWTTWPVSTVLKQRNIAAGGTIVQAPAGVALTMGLSVACRPTNPDTAIWVETRIRTVSGRVLRTDRAEGGVDEGVECGTIVDWPYPDTLVGEVRVSHIVRFDGTVFANGQAPAIS